MHCNMLSGIVVSGKKEGKKYILLYQKQIMDKLGIKPFAGTLNLKVGKIIEDLKKIDGIIIDKFVKNGIEYGKVKCFPIKFFNEDAFLLLPEKSRYKDIVEIIAKENLREKYDIKDGDEIEINFKPFIKNNRKYKVYAEPFIGKKEAEITIFYDFPFSSGRRELCYLKNFENSYRKTITGYPVACNIFMENEKEAYEELFDFIGNNGYSIMSPIRKIKYSYLNEWQIEIKISHS